MLGRVVALGALVGPWALVAPAAAQEAPEGPPALVTPAPTGRSGAPADGRPVEVATELLTPGVARRVEIGVGAMPRLEVDLVPTASGASGWSAWSGAVDGSPHSSVDVVRRGDVVAGLVVTLDGTYRIQNVGGGAHVLRTVDRTFVDGPDTLTPDRAPAAATAPDAPAAEPAPTPRAGDVPPVVDVLGAYTPAAQAEAGGQSAIESEIALGISVTNTAYAQSGINGSLRLVGTQRTSANVLADSAGLQKLTVGNDGIIDEVPTRRTALGADVVSLFTGETASGCGIGWLLQSLDQGGGLGLSLVDWTCAVDNMSMAHEIGHNMGLEHDRYVSPTNRLYDWGHGYVNVAGGWRTIMAYNDACAAASTYCTRLARFSNPDQTYAGAPLGRPASGSQSADSRRVLNATFSVVADWRSQPAPFGSWAAFVTQQLRDLEGRTPGAAERTTLANGLANGDTSPGRFIDARLHGAPFGSAYAPVSRLYLAFFLRIPDKAGLDYWVGRYRAGMSLPAIANLFAGSQEFRTRYGSLGNRAFVEQVYLNVLGRPGEPAGVNFWTAELDSRRRNRGTVMVGFSEASEYKRIRTQEVDTILVFRGLLQRVPTTTEYQQQVARMESGTPVTQVIVDLLATSEYRTRATL